MEVSHHKITTTKHTHPTNPTGNITIQTKTAWITPLICQTIITTATITSKATVKTTTAATMMKNDHQDNQGTTAKTNRGITIVTIKTTCHYHCLEITPIKTTNSKTTTQETLEKH